MNIKTAAPMKIAVGISTEPGVMEVAAERLLGLSAIMIQELSEDIIKGQLRLAEWEGKEKEVDKFLEGICQNIENEIKKIGMRIINISLPDFRTTY